MSAIDAGLFSEEEINYRAKTGQERSGNMGLFRRGETAHQKKARKAYECFSRDMAIKIFPDGTEQVGNIVLSLAEIYQLNPEECDVKKYYDILSTYSCVAIRRLSDNDTDDGTIIAALQIKYPKLIPDKETAEKVLAYADADIDEHNPAPAEDIIAMFRRQWAEEAARITSRNNGMEKIYQDDPDYGLVAEKPVFTVGVQESYRYVDALRTASGKRLIWERTGSVYRDGGAVDIYEMRLLTGGLYGKVFINMYGNENPDRAPRGYILDWKK